MMEPEIRGSIFVPGVSPIPADHFTTWIQPEPRGLTPDEVGSDPFL